MKALSLTCLAIMMGTSQMKHLLVETGTGGKADEAGFDYSEDYGVDYVGEDKVGVLTGLLKKQEFGKALKLLENEEFVKALLPEILNLDKLFNNLDKIVPGMKGLQTDVVEMYNIIKKRKLMW